jgi:hypothetical protein
MFANSRECTDHVANVNERKGSNTLIESFPYQNESENLDFYVNSPDIFKTLSEQEGYYTQPSFCYFCN